MQLFSIVINWANKMNFSLYANMMGAQTVRYIIHRLGEADG